MRQEGGEITITIEELAAMLRERFHGRTFYTVHIESYGKTIIAVNFDMRSDNYHSVSTAQVTHWVGMDRMENK